jgi:hypothetical protein
MFDVVLRDISRESDVADALDSYAPERAWWRSQSVALFAGFFVAARPAA